MARSAAQAAPTEPQAPAPDPQAVVGLDTTDIRPTEEMRLDDAVSLPVAAPEGDNETPPPAQRRQSRHDTQMEAIVARRREKLEAERAEAHRQGFTDQEPLTPQTPIESPAVVAAPVVETPVVQSPIDPAIPAIAPRVHKILVRGNEIQMSDDDMRRAAELGVESELRIRHANAALEEARRLAAASGYQIPGAGQSPPAAAPLAQTREPSGIDRDALRDVAKELLYGDEEKVVDALQRVVAPHAAPPIDQDAMAREIYARLDGRLNLQTALQTFGSEFPDIVNDPDLVTLGANYVQQLRTHYAQTGTPRSELDLFREAGNATRQAVQRWRSGGEQPTQPAPEPVQQTVSAPPAGTNRTAIKRATPQAPAAAAAPQTAPIPRAPTGTDIVNQMRRARGQPVYA